MRAFEFVRLHDGLSYRFEPLPDGRWKRTDLELFCALTSEGWRILDAGGEVSGWPLDAPGASADPPATRWQSRKGEKSYIYNLVYV